MFLRWPSFGGTSWKNIDSVCSICAGSMRGARVEDPVPLVGEAGRVLEDHVRTAGRGVALLGNGAVEPPVAEVAVLAMSSA